MSWKNILKNRNFTRKIRGKKKKPRRSDNPYGSDRYMTPEELEAHLKKKTEDRAMSLILEAVQETPYATIENNTVILKPEWLEFRNYRDKFGIRLARGEQILNFQFDLDMVNEPNFCLFAETSVQGKQRLCLHQGINPSEAIPADFYVTLIMVIGNWEQFSSMW